MDLDWWGSGEDLGGIGEGENHNQNILCKKNPFSNKKKKVCLKKSQPDNNDGKGEQVKDHQHFRWLNTLGRTGEQRS